MNEGFGDNVSDDGSKASNKIKNREKGICLDLRKQLSKLTVGATAPMPGSSQNDLVFSSMLRISRKVGNLCRGVSIDNESDQAT